MIYSIKIILIAQLVVIFILIISYIIESFTGLKLFVWGFKVKKNLKMANGAADLDSIIYFLVCLDTLLYDRYISGNKVADFSFWIWFFIVLTLTIIFRKLYFKFTPKDTNRGDYDFSD